LIGLNIPSNVSIQNDPKTFLRIKSSYINYGYRHNGQSTASHLCPNYWLQKKIIPILSKLHSIISALVLLVNDRPSDALRPASDEANLVVEEHHRQVSFRSFRRLNRKDLIANSRSLELFFAFTSTRNYI